MTCICQNPYKLTAQHQERGPWCKVWTLVNNASVLAHQVQRMYHIMSGETVRVGVHGDSVDFLFMFSVNLTVP